MRGHDRPEPEGGRVVGGGDRCRWKSGVPADAFLGSRDAELAGEQSGDRGDGQAASRKSRSPAAVIASDAYSRGTARSARDGVVPVKSWATDQLSRSLQAPGTP